MIDESDHAACVRAWRARLGRTASALALTRASEQAFRAIWTRAHVTLGDVTLTAIGDRILYDAAERFPILCGVRLEPPGISFEDLDLRSLDVSNLDAAVSFVLAELLSVLGRITGEVMTPALHAALDAAPIRDGGRP